MDVCVYSTLMVELLQISRTMSDLEFIITIGVMQLITTWSCLLSLSAL